MPGDILRKAVQLRLSRKAGFDGRINNSAGMLGICSNGSDHWVPGRILRRKGGTEVKRKRTQKEIKQDSKKHYGGLAEINVDLNALRKFRTKPYECVNLIRAQGEQMEEKKDG